jgi:hypothetical protein
VLVLVSGRQAGDRLDLVVPVRRTHDAKGGREAEPDIFF